MKCSAWCFTHECGVSSRALTLPICLQKHTKSYTHRSSRRCTAFTITSELFMARCSLIYRTWLPDRPADSSSDRPSTNWPLLYPDTVYSSAADYFRVWIHSWNEPPMEILSCLGFDLLTHLFRAFNKDGRYGQYLEAWLLTFTDDLRWGPYYLYSIYRDHFFSLCQK